MVLAIASVVNVMVITARQTSAARKFAAAPRATATVTSVTPNQGAKAGSTVLAINGTGLQRYSP